MASGILSISLPTVSWPQKEIHETPTCKPDEKYPVVYGQEWQWHQMLGIRWGRCCMEEVCCSIIRESLQEKWNDHLLSDELREIPKLHHQSKVQQIRTSPLPVLHRYHCGNPARDKRLAVYCGLGNPSWTEWSMVSWKHGFVDTERNHCPERIKPHTEGIRAIHQAGEGKILYI